MSDFEEIEIDKDDIYAYLYDEQDLEIGFSIMNEDGVETEYYYTEDEIKRTNNPERAQDIENVKRVTQDLNKMYHQNKDVIDDLKDAVSDINYMFNGITK